MLWFLYDDIMIIWCTYIIGNSNNLRKDRWQLLEYVQMSYLVADNTYKMTLLLINFDRCKWIIAFIDSMIPILVNEYAKQSR